MIAAVSAPSAPCDFPWVHVPDLMTKRSTHSAAALTQWMVLNGRSCPQSISLPAVPHGVAEF